MTLWHEDREDFDEMPDEYPEEEDQRLAEMLDMETPDVYWANYIEKIPDLEIKKKEIEIADKHNEKWNAVEEKVDSGEISEVDYFGEQVCRRWPEERKHATRCGLESEGLTPDDLGDVAEDYDFLIADAGGNPKPARMKNEIKEMICHLGPEASQKLADEMLEDGKISKEAHDTISRQVRLHGK